MSEPVRELHIIRKGLAKAKEQDLEVEFIWSMLDVARSRIEDSRPSYHELVNYGLREWDLEEL